MIQPGAPIVLVTDPGLEVEAKNRLARIGFDRVVGYLADPLEALEEHPDDVARSSRLTVRELALRLRRTANCPTCSSSTSASRARRRTA